MNRPGRVTLLAITATLAAPAIVPAADPPERRKPAIIERATVELVLIELYATDGEGRPIRDLTPDDLILTVDSYRKPVYSLEFREAGGVVGATAAGPGVVEGVATVTVPPRNLSRRFL